MTKQLLAFQVRFNAPAEPFDWKFSRANLNDLLRRLAAHDPQTPQPELLAA